LLCIKIKISVLVRKISQTELDKLRQEFVNISEFSSELKPRFLDFSQPLKTLKSKYSSLKKGAKPAPIFVHDIPLSKTKDAAALLEKLTWLATKNSKNSYPYILMTDFVALSEYFMNSKLEFDDKAFGTFLTLKDYCIDLSVFEQLSSTRQYPRFTELFSRLGLFFSLQPKRMKRIGFVVPDIVKRSEIDPKTKIRDITSEVLTVSRTLFHLQFDHEFIPEADLLKSTPKFDESGLLYNGQKLDALILLSHFKQSEELLNVLKTITENGIFVFAVFPLKRGRRMQRRYIAKMRHEFFGDLFYRYRSPSAHFDTQDKLFFFVPYEISSEVKAEIYIEDLLNRFHDPAIKINELVRIKRHFKNYIFSLGSSTFVILINGTNKTNDIKVNLDGVGNLLNWGVQDGLIQQFKVFSELSGKTSFSMEFLPHEFRMIQLIPEVPSLHITKTNMIVEDFNSKTGDLIGYSSMPDVFIGINEKYYHFKKNEMIQPLDFLNKWLIRPSSQKLSKSRKKTKKLNNHIYIASNSIEIPLSNDHYRFFLDFNGLTSAMEISVNDKPVQSVCWESDRVEITKFLTTDKNKIDFKFITEGKNISGLFKTVRIVPKYSIKEKLDLKNPPALI